MDYTKNYHLPQWKKEDRIMMEDFNQMCADIESGLSDAKESAQEAKAEAARLPYVTGEYVGTDEYNRHFVLGFRPSFLLVGTQFERATTSPGLDPYSCFTCGGIIPNHLQLTDDGFTINCNREANFPKLNSKGLTYNYIAFR